jgi:RNA-directed DNA polymerase
MSTAATSVYEWRDLDWRAIEQQVFKLQTRIYRASRRGDAKTVHRLQRLLLASWAARCLAVRRVTQDNRGKRTAGVDGVKNLPPSQRLRLARHLTLVPTAQPARRIWIPKPGTTEQRPLAIPVLSDRARQALALLALEPEWEARFEPHSYGFRPGRSTHDAIEAIFQAICRKPKYVLDADIAKCFERIDQSALLAKLHTFPRLRRAVRAWLKAGVLDGAELFPTTAGTPQGGVASPLLANIALHGLETAITTAFPPTKVVNGRRVNPWRPSVIRYADDLVVLHEDEGVIREAHRLVSTWLAGMGLELKPAKTRLTHTLTPFEGHVGFDFLGFQVRQHRVGRTHTGRDGLGRPLGFKTLITPSRGAQQRHQQAIRTRVRRQRAVSQAALIAELNPLIRGWARYYATVVAKETFTALDAWLFALLLRWAKRRHPTKGATWITRKYWRREAGAWDFGPRGGPRLFKHRHQPIRRHAKVVATRSIYDGDWAYWGTRLGRHPTLPTRVATLLRRQRGRCARCGLYFTSGALPEVDHILPRAQGGIDAYFNWQLLHRHCHDAKTAQDGSSAARGTHHKGSNTEEPGAGTTRTPGSGGGRGGATLLA